MKSSSPGETLCDPNVKLTQCGSVIRHTDPSPPLTTWLLNDAEWPIFVISETLIILISLEKSS